MRFSITALDPEKVHDTASENGETGKPKEEDVPHSDKGTGLHDLGTTEQNIVMIVISREHHHISDVAERLQNVNPETEHADHVSLVRLDHHAFFWFEGFQRVCVFLVDISRSLHRFALISLPPIARAS